MINLVWETNKPNLVFTSDVIQVCYAKLNFMIDRGADTRYRLGFYMSNRIVWLKDFKSKAAAEHYANIFVNRLSRMLMESVDDFPDNNA